MSEEMVQLLIRRIDELLKENDRLKGLIRDPALCQVELGLENARLIEENRTWRERALATPADKV